MRLWKKGKLNAYQLPTGTVIVTDEEIAPPHPVEVAWIYTRVSSAENKDNLKRQSERLVSYKKIIAELKKEKEGEEDAAS